VRSPAAAARPQEDVTMERLFRSLVFLAFALALTLALLAPRSGRALPLWARQYSMPCTSCHLAFPRLNDFGMGFRQRGYILPGGEGQSPWESQFVPIAVVGNVGYDVLSTNHYDPVAGTWSRFTQASFVQNQYEFHSAGTLAKKISFHFDNNFSAIGGPLLSGMAFVQFDDVVKDGALNVKAGIFDAEVPYLSSSRRTTWHDYMLPGTLPGEGVELNGAKNGWTYAVALLNSSRSLDSLLARRPGTKSFNALEDPYAWLMRDVGPHKVTARVFLDRQDSRRTGHSASNHVQADVNALLEFGKLWVIPDYTYESFADVDSVAIPAAIHRALIEAVAVLGGGGRTLLTGRYELAHNAARTTADGIQVPEADVGLGTLNLSYYVNPNAKLALDWSQTWDNIRGDRVDEFVGY
jgi:hypothetical protein